MFCQSTLSSCPFAACIFFFKRKRLTFSIHSIQHHLDSHSALFDPTCASWPAGRVCKAEGSFCWWGAAVPPSVCGNSSPAPSGTLSGLDQSGFCSYAGHLHTFYKIQRFTKQCYSLIKASVKHTFTVHHPAALTSWWSPWSRGGACCGVGTVLGHWGFLREKPEPPPKGPEETRSLTNHLHFISFLHLWKTWDHLLFYKRKLNYFSCLRLIIYRNVYVHT